jgi:hypothetical protein
VRDNRREPSSYCTGRGGPENAKTRCDLQELWENAKLRKEWDVVVFAGGKWDAMRMCASSSECQLNAEGPAPQCSGGGLEEVYLTDDMGVAIWSKEKPKKRLKGAE